MKHNLLSKVNVKLHFRENRSFYFSFLLCLILGLIIGIIIVASNESYLNLVTSKNKILYSYINGTASVSSLFWQQFFKFLLPVILIFILGFNFYTSLLSFIFITYQSAIFVMLASALISLFGFSGVLNFLLIMLPVNLIYFAVLTFFCVTVISRAKSASRYKSFMFGFDDRFIFKIIFSIIMVLALCILSSLIYPLFLKSAIFMIF